MTVYLDQAIISLVLHCHEDSMAQDVQQDVMMRGKLESFSWLIIRWAKFRNSAFCYGALLLVDIWNCNIFVLKDCSQHSSYGYTVHSFIIQCILIFFLDFIFELYILKCILHTQCLTNESIIIINIMHNIMLQVAT